MFNLLHHTFYQYRKENKKISYINSKSNYPPTTLKQIPKMIEDRLSKNLCEKKDYNDASKINVHS